MSLMKNELEWITFFVSQILLNLITPRALPVVQNLQILIRDWSLIIVRKKVFIVHLNGLQQPDCKYYIFKNLHSIRN